MSVEKHVYENDGIVVTWEPAKCQHSKRCWMGLLPVFDPRRRPWVMLDQATNERIAEQIDQCPSGALSYELKEGKGAEE